MLVWFLWFSTGVLAIVGVYGLHRVCLYLEQRGYLYYLHTKPQGSVAPALLDLRELVQPSIRHVIEAKEEGRIKRDAVGDGPEPGNPDLHL